MLIGAWVVASVGVTGVIVGVTGVTVGVTGVTVGVTVLVCFVGIVGSSVGGAGVSVGMDGVSVTTGVMVGRFGTSRACPILIWVLARQLARISSLTLMPYALPILDNVSLGWTI